MKKYIFFFILSLCFLIFVSCAPASHLNSSDYGEAFREKNEILFENTECDHDLIHSHINGRADPSVSTLYHETSCKWGNCGYEVRYTPHMFLFFFDELPTARAHYKENGYLYHSFNKACEECNGTITVHVLCRTQDAECGAGTGTIHAPAQCFVGCDWGELFADTPYRIILKSDE